MITNLLHYGLRGEGALYLIILNNYLIILHDTQRVQQKGGKLYLTLYILLAVRIIGQATNYVPYSKYRICFVHRAIYSIQFLQHTWSIDIRSSQFRTNEETKQDSSNRIHASAQDKK